MIIFAKSVTRFFPNSMDALMHTAKDHTKKIIEELPKINSDIVKDAVKSDNKEHLDKKHCQVEVQGKYFWTSF